MTAETFAIAALVVVPGAFTAACLLGMLVQLVIRGMRRKP